MSFKKSILNIFKIIGLLIILITPSFFAYKAIQKPISNIINRTEIIGLSQIPTEEIWGIVDQMNLNNKSFAQINARKISKQIEEHPLVKKARIKALLFPQVHYKIYIWEEDPWAILNNKLFNQNCSEIASPNNKFFAKQSVQKIYQDFANHRLGSPIGIQSSHGLSTKDLKRIKKLSLESQYILNLVQKDSIQSIIIDNENSLIIKFHRLKLILGPINKSTESRLHKLKSSLFTLQKILSSQRLEYIDLSLDTEDVLLGKTTSEAEPKEENPML